MHFFLRGCFQILALLVLNQTQRQLGQVPIWGERWGEKTGATSSVISCISFSCHIHCFTLLFQITTAIYSFIALEARSLESRCLQNQTPSLALKALGRLLLALEPPWLWPCGSHLCLCLCMAFFLCVGLCVQFL